MLSLKVTYRIFSEPTNAVAHEKIKKDMPLSFPIIPDKLAK